MNKKLIDKETTDLSDNARRFLELREKCGAYKIGDAHASAMVNRYDIVLSEDKRHLVFCNGRPTTEDEQFIRAHKEEYIDYLSSRIARGDAFCDLTDAEVEEVEAYDEAHKPEPNFDARLTISQMLGADE